MEAISTQRERFIPFRRRDILAMCLAEGALQSEDARAFAHCAALLESLIHHEFHKQLEALKDAYAPVAADGDTRRLAPTGGAGGPQGGDLVGALRTVLERANFEAVPASELHRALAEESLFRVRLHVEYDDFAEVLVFKRGEGVRSERMRVWFGLRSRNLTFVNYDRVLIYVRFKAAEHFSRRRRKRLLFAPGSVFLKLFQDIPKADVEMLFPNAEVRMKAIDKLAIGVPALVSGAIVAITKLGATVVLIGGLLAFWLGLRKDEVRLDQAALLGLAAGFFALGGYLWRQFSVFRNRKIKFLKLLADNLYFKKLDMNDGVFHRLIDAAEEEECKEALLAFYFLVAARGPRKAAALDSEIETWFRNKWQCAVNFDVEDALDKLVKFAIAEKTEKGYSAVSLAEARRRLDRRWDDIFEADEKAAAIASPAPAPRQAA